MKKFMWLVAGICVTTALVAGEWYGGKATVEAGDTTGVSEVIPLYKFTGGGATDLVRITAHVDSGSGTGTLVFASMDHGIATTIATSSAISGSTLYDNYPMRTFTGASQTVNVSSNYPVAYINPGGTYTDTNGTVIAMATVTNYYMLTVPYTATSTTTSYGLYPVRELRVSVTQAASAADTVYKFSVFVE